MSEPQHLVKMFKALSNPNRFRLFVEIARSSGASIEPGDGCFVHTIMARLNIGAPTVSHHVKELVNAGLITTERDGKYLRCRADDAALDALSSFFTATR